MRIFNHLSYWRAGGARNKYERPALVLGGAAEMSGPLYGDMKSPDNNCNWWR